MPRKFGIDKRIITLSAQVLSGEITREDALGKMKLPPYDLNQMEIDKDYVIKKLELSSEEFDRIWNMKNHYYWDYPSYMPIYQKYYKISRSFLRYFFPTLPTILVETEYRLNEKTN